MTHPEAASSVTDQRSVEQAYRLHLPAILRYLRRRLGDDVAEDAAADVFTRAIRAHANGQAVSLPWLFGVAANVISERRRSERRRLRAIERLAEQASSAETPVEERAALDPALVRALRSLSRRDREALLLVAWGELTYDQVAEALGVPVGTVRSRIFRARSQLASTTSRARAAADPPVRQMTRSSHV
jgi:RNA polymerase sigma-70 factor (ECF subfamily)